MTHARIHHLAVGIMAIALIIAVMLALSATTVPARARTFSFNSAGSLVQQPLPSDWACAISRALSDRTFPCRDSAFR